MVCLHSDTWHTDWMYIVSSYTFQNSHLSQWTKRFWRVSILTRVTLLNFSCHGCPYCHVLHCTNVFVNRSKMYKCQAEQHLQWHESQCTKVILKRVKMYKFSFDNLETIQAFMWQLPFHTYFYVTRVTLHRILVDICPIVQIVRCLVSYCTKTIFAPVIIAFFHTVHT